jgi:hypothetical protein
MNLLDATLAFMEDATDIVLKAPERDDDGIGQSATPVPSRTRPPRASKATPPHARKLLPIRALFR